AVLTLERIRELRFPSLRSRPSTVEIWDREKLGISAELCGQLGSPTHVLKTFTAEHGRRKCQWVSWEELSEIVKEKRKVNRIETQILAQNAKLQALTQNNATPFFAQNKIKIENNCDTREISATEYSETKKYFEKEKISGITRFKTVYAVGHEVETQARTVGERVIFVEKMAPREIAEAVKDAEVVLWNADLWGRRTAPQVAALLGTGLCADCTALETDGETLFMYRPARSGNILAKIECRTRPQMATVRTTGESADVILAGGRGVADYWSEVLELAEKLNAEPAASRALVDTGKVPYEFQIGLTGKSVSPKVYIAVGISGAVQHTCAMETAGTVIAINPDRDARIFDYADYGILGKFPQ
ncbi:MAG: electron transfer flavoprotein subunit alpha/FixB family protein, partial [Planctomycetia bacterium]|nr:electron transfer flavoprotein subunit alpha/FixB family protein [Planctomycetia bacterium]